jgi:hypothetical protein
LVPDRVVCVIYGSSAALLIFQFSTLNDHHGSRARVVFSSDSPCLDQLVDLALWEAELVTGPVEAESALVERLKRIPDYRDRRRRRHPLVVVLALAACATLVVGSDSSSAIWQWAARSS